MYIYISDNHDILSVKFYELGSDVNEDPEKFLDVEPNAEGAEAERGKLLFFFKEINDFIVKWLPGSTSIRRRIKS